MPQRARGPRQPLTIRLPFDLYRECASRARTRNWSMSDFVAHCVAKEISGKFVPTRVTTPHNSEAARVADEWLAEHG